MIAFRYEDPDVTNSDVPMPRSQGADLAALLSVDHSDFRHRYTGTNPPSWREQSCTGIAM